MPPTPSRRNNLDAGAEAQALAAYLQVGPAPVANTEAEQALLGCLMMDNSAYVDIEGKVTAADFFEPFHGRLFKAMTNLIKVGRMAEPIILMEFFRIDAAFAELGGLRYLADLVDKAPPPSSAGHFAGVLQDLARRRDVISICANIAERARNDSEATGTSLMGDLERDVLASRSGHGEISLRSWDDVAQEVVYGMDRPDDVPLLKCGLAKIDDAVGGFERGDLVILGARPSMGKSALAGCIALNVARAHMDGLSAKPQGVVELNGEMTTVQMMRRHLTDQAFSRYGLAGPVYRDIKRKALTPAQMEIIRQVEIDLRGLPMKMLKRTGMTLGQARAMLRRQKMLWESEGVEMSMVVVDHVGLIRPDEAGRGRTEDQTIISASLKEMADELGVVMIGLAQLNRKVEERDDKRPQLSDLRDSGSWEQDADIVMGVYRDAYYARREREPKREPERGEWVIRQGSQEVEAIMLKIREGDAGVAKLWADIGRNAIRDHEPHGQTAFDVAPGALF